MLFLLRSVIQELRSKKAFIQSLLSIHVDHDLQAAAKSMAECAEKNARDLGVDFYTTKIPWSTPPFPPRPTHDQALEELARDARRNRLFHAMLQNSVNTIAFGQHADDQVETVLMRLAAGTSLAGASGMRPVRRMGMGDRGDRGMTYFGLLGMSQWVVRPLLSVSKVSSRKLFIRKNNSWLQDRILATCEANGLKYVHDPTNFQPEITLRNALRIAIAKVSLISQFTVSVANVLLHSNVSVRITNSSVYICYSAHENWRYRENSSLRRRPSRSLTTTPQGRSSSSASFRRS